MSSQTLTMTRRSTTKCFKAVLRNRLVCDTMFSTMSSLQQQIESTYKFSYSLMGQPLSRDSKNYLELAFMLNLVEVRSKSVLITAQRRRQELSALLRLYVENNVGMEMEEEAIEEMLLRISNLIEVSDELPQSTQIFLYGATEALLHCFSKLAPTILDLGTLSWSLANLDVEKLDGSTTMSQTTQNESTGKTRQSTTTSMDTQDKKQQSSTTSEDGYHIPPCYA